MAEIQFDEQVDITDKVCPLTFVKAKVSLDELDDGEILAIRMNDGEPVQNVPRSIKEEGHKILKLVDNEDGTYTLYVRKMRLAMTDEQIERYSRHIILKEVGTDGQKKLLNANVLVIGAGGLGAPAAMYLAAAGVGTIGIVDPDEVDLSNLQRQIIHATKDLGKAKVKSAKETIEKLNPDVKVNTYQIFVDSSNIRELIRKYDFIIDGTDNFQSKFLINDACVLEKKPFSHAGIIQFQGQLMTYVPGKGPCYRCVFQDPPPEDAVPTCRQAGVVGAVGGVIGSLQAMEAIKYIIGKGELLTGYLLTYDALKMEFRKIRLPKDTHRCAVCGENPTITDLVDYERNVCKMKS